MRASESYNGLQITEASKMVQVITLLLILSTTLLSYPVSTKGPRGETPVPSSLIELTSLESTTVQKDSLTLAVALHDTLSEFSQVLLRSIRAECEQLNVKLLFTGSAQFSVPIQKKQYQTLLSLKPDLLITLSLSPQETTEELKELSRSGTSISFLSNLPGNMNHPEEYASVISDDFFGMGSAMAHVIAQESGKNTRLLYVYHDADYYVTNQRDQSLHTVLSLKFPEISIVDSIPIGSPNELIEKLQPWLNKNIDRIDAIYTPWATIAEEALLLLNTYEQSPDLYTIDLSSHLLPNLIEGNRVKGVISDLPAELGRALLISGILHHYKRAVPAFAMVPVEVITRENALQQWTTIMGLPLTGNSHAR